MSVAPDPAKRGAGPGEEARGIKAWFHEQHRRTSYITVSMTVLGLLVTAALGLWNISLQFGRPELEPLYGRIRVYEEGAGWRGEVVWRNAGKQLANSLFVTVYAADKDGMRQDKLWGAFCKALRGFQPIISVRPSDQVPCEFRLGVVNPPPDHLLICGAYRSESWKKYRQAFRYRVLPPVQQQREGEPPRWTTQLEEEFPRPSEKVCR
jgi:hypothetical protein